MQSPFKFLDSFTKEDKAIFFGRDKETAEIYSRCFESKILLVYGVSGTGKTSLINCGLANRFNDSDWLPINIRRGSDINESLAYKINQFAITEFSSPVLGETQRGAKRQLQSLYLDHFKPIYLIFDQFEELFIFGNADERKQFVKTVKSLVESDIQCKFIFVIREEYLASVTEFENEIPDFFTNRLRIEKMNLHNAKQAIEGPCHFAGITLEPGFADALLEKLSPKTKDIELTYLQVFLDKIYRISLSSSEVKAPPIGGDSEGVETSPPSRGETQRGAFTLSTLTSLGDVKDLLGSFLEEQVSQLDDPDSGLVILKSFVSVKGTKRQITENEVLDYSRTLGKNIAPHELTALIQKFVALRILRDKDESGRYELRHDALASKIYEKITLVEKELMEVRQFVENAFSVFVKRGILLNRDDLAYLEKYKSILFLPASLDEFVEKSHHYEKSKTKIVKNITTVTAVIFLLSMIFTGIFLIRTSRTNSSTRLANSSMSTVLSPKDQFMMAKGAYNDDISCFSKKAVMDAYYRIISDPGYDTLLLNYRPYHFQFQAEVVSAKFSYDGQKIYGFTGSGDFFIINTGEKTLKTIPTGKHSLLAMAFSPDNRVFATISRDSVVKVWNENGKEIFKFKTSFNQMNTNHMVCFSAERNQIISLFPDKDAVVFDSAGNIIQYLAEHSGKINAVDISKNEKFIATASADHTVNIWYYNQVRHRYDIYNKIHCHEDTVWSVEFSKNNQYILTASADSGAYIWSLNGEFIDNIDDYISLAGVPYSKICDARFSESNAGIILTRYNDQTTYKIPDLWAYNQYSFKLKNDEIKNYKTAQFYQGTSRFAFAGYSIYVNNKFESIEFLPDNSLSAVVPSKQTETWLMELQLDYRIHSFRGTKPCISPDGKFLLTIDNSTIYLFPVDIRKMLNMLNDIDL